MAEGHGINFVRMAADGVHLGDYEPLISALLVGGALIFAGSVAVSAMRSAPHPLVPDKKLSSRTVFEGIGELVTALSDSVMGRENRKYLPFLCVLFTYILAMNLLGLIPGFAMPTSQIPINASIAVIVFVLYHYWGMREQGVLTYLKHFGGPVLLLWPLIFCVELVSNVIRPVTLTLRLFGNMQGDHAVFGVFVNLTKIGVPVAFYIMGTLVSVIQAFVFTVLTMVYIKLAVSHGDSHEEAH